MSHNHRPMVGVAVVIKNCDKVLIGLRGGNHASGKFGFPGGHLEYGESFADAAIRETFEETGITITNPKLWWFENVIFSDEGKHYVTIFMVADDFKGEPKAMEPDKCAEWVWAAWDELPQPLMPGIVMLLEEGLNPFKTKGLYVL